MTRTVVLDAGPLGMIAHPKRNPEVSFWLAALSRAGLRIVIPEIADYEVRRELLRAKMRKSLKRLNRLTSTMRYAPITTQVMLRAAEFWAQARRAGRPTADDKALDCDMILAAQACNSLATKS